MPSSAAEGMDYFSYQNDEACCESVPLSRIVQSIGTPAYVYSGTALDGQCRELKSAFRPYPTLTCYAVKANHNLSILKRIFHAGFGADVVSAGELERVLLAGAKPNEIVFSGVGKTDAEILRGLEVGILSFNVESAGELKRIAALAEKTGRTAGVSLRINPNIDVQTNPYIATGLYSTKFGIAESDLRPLVNAFKDNRRLKILGLACHIGSQITELGPFREAVRRLSKLAIELKAEGLPLELLDLGGGLGIRYHDEELPGLDDYSQTLIEEARKTGLRLLIEPGRSLIGNIGILLTSVIGVKQTAEKTFIIVDAAMNDLIRPSLYGAYHEILPVRSSSMKAVKVDIVGLICETGDFLGHDRLLTL